MKKILFLAILFLSPNLWCLTSPEKFKSARSEVTLVSALDSIGPETRQLHLALAYTLTPHWHIYWKNSGDSGTPPTLEWEGSDSALKFSDVLWPTPRRIPATPLMSYAYEERVLLPVKVEIPAGTKDDLRIQLQADWLICKVDCVPEQKKFTLTLPFGTEKLARESAEIQKFISKAPEQLPSLRASLQRKDGNFVLEFSSELDGIFSDVQSAYFFAGEGLRIQHAAEQKILFQDDRTLRLQIVRDDNDDETKQSLPGILELKKSSGIQAVTAEAKLNESSGPFVWQELLLSLFFAFIGGLILNLMPCVFPVLFLKLYALTHKSANKQNIRRDAWAYTAGVLVSFWALAFLLWILKGAGLAVGWGFQLQSPAFIAGAFLLFIALGLSLLGVFELGGAFTGAGQSLTQKSGLQGSFFTGVLATLVATPCSAPFMGAAVGYALTRASWETLPIFTLLGLGLALPYLLLAYFPRLLQWIPKPGVWMEHLKQFFGFTLFATALWLLWIFGTQKSSDAVIALLAAGLCLSLALWGMKLQLHLRIILLVLSGAAGLVFASRAITSESAQATASADKDWEVFQPEKLQAYRTEGRAVFIDFTAAWCLTCQVNKKLVLHTPAAAELFSNANIVRLRADWTTYDPVITRALAEYSRQSVPVYVYYPASGGEAQLLPELLTLDILRSAFAKAK